MHKRVLAIGVAAMLSAGLIGYSAAAATATTDLSAAPKKTTTTKTTTVKRSGGGTAVKRTTVKKTTVRAPAAARKPVVVKRTVVVRGYRPWVRRTYYGTAFIGAVALGTIIAVSAPHIVPVAPGPNACWYWSDPDEIHGYWDYCVPPP
jgi:hypothetical protein